MKAETSLVASQVRLREWAAQIRECQNRPQDIHIHGKDDKERSVAITDATASHLKKYLRLFHPEMGAVAK